MIEIKKGKAAACTVKKLKPKRKYYIRIRAYKLLKGRKISSDWSKIKKVTTK